MTFFNGLVGGIPSAGQGTYHSYGAAFAGAIGEGFVLFANSLSTAGNGTFINDGGIVSGAPGGLVSFTASSTSADAIFTNRGGIVAAAGGGLVTFSDTSTADNATLINEDAGATGAAGGMVQFLDDSDGGSARMKVFGAGQLDISAHNLPGVTIGSLEGNGIVLLGGNKLTIGANDRSTIFSGALQDGGSGGSLMKIGTGTLSLRHASSYSGGTVVSGGILLVENQSGSATGSGPVEVTAGTLSGNGIIEGPVTVGTGAGTATLAPGKRRQVGRLTIWNSLTFDSVASYEEELDSGMISAAQVVALGVTINDGAQIIVTGLSAVPLLRGTVFILISNVATTPIDGTFTNLFDGSTIAIGSNTYLVSYEGGDGNDLTLTVQ
jgi:autotransporter-associated beta strand protein